MIYTVKIINECELTIDFLGCSVTGKGILGAVILAIPIFLAMSAPWIVHLLMSR
jgi:hypothetical protein